MANALVSEKSPYLRQHASNPVAWLPWGAAAFAQARAEEKPIFLSIGYSTCHWCHVMAHESFEDEGVAAILNEHFVAIKVDREERPDVDKVYMAYVQALTGHGGWPLSAWLTPELKPFFGGTYFPPEDRHGRAGFPTILRAIAGGWKNERAKLLVESERVLGTLRDYHGGRRTEDGGQGKGDGPLAVAGGEAFEQCFQYYYENFDAANGGFGGAPKFPRASNLNFLFRVAAIQGVQSEIGAEAVRLATATLRAMARGGIHDHVGGGYHRYAVDETWFVPHFEKMLYDQAQIALNCLEAKQATGDERFAWMARDIFDYVARDLTSPLGGFFTAEDADSEETGHGGQETGHKQEGAFYVWSAAELRDVLGDDAGLIAAHFGVLDEGNVTGPLDPHGEFRGKNILVQRQSLGETAKQFSLTVEQANERIGAALEKLKVARDGRLRPLRDDKIITAWNGLMISALARGAQVLGGEHEERGRFLGAAVRAAEFVERELWDGARGVLFRCWREGRGVNEGFAEDYAYFIQGLLDLYEASFTLRWLAWADDLQERMDGLFWDEARGGYFNSAAGDASIVLRLKEDYDGAEPAPSSVAAMNLLRLATLLHDDERRGRGVRCIEAFRTQWVGTPQGMPQMVCALELALEAPRHVVLVGDPNAADFRALAAVVQNGLGPRRALVAVSSDAEREWWSERAPWMTDMVAIAGRATAYVCEEYSCQAPVTEAVGLRRVLGQR